MQTPKLAIFIDVYHVGLRFKTIISLNDDGLIFLSCLFGVFWGNYVQYLIMLPYLIELPFFEPYLCPFGSRIANQCRN